MSMRRLKGGSGNSGTLSSRGYRIAVVAACPYPVPQGSQVLIRDTACMLRDRGHDVQLFTYGYGIGDCPAGLTVRSGANVRGARRTKAGPSVFKPLLDFRLMRTLKTALRREPFDCVYAHNYEGLAVALAARQCPIVYHAHNAMADELPHYFPFARMPRAFGALLDRALPKRADAVIAPHDRLAEYLVDCGCPRDRVHVIPPAADNAVNAVVDADSRLASVLYTGNLDAYQNLELLEAAMAHARKTQSKLELLVATSESVCSLPNATLVPTPNYASLRDALSNDVVVACPRISWSGYPIKLLNAMAAGRAIVACESAAYPLRDGENGRVVADSDAEAFGTALLELATNGPLRQRLGNAARETAQRDHHAERIGAAIEAAVGKVAAPRPTVSEERVVSSR